MKHASVSRGRGTAAVEAPLTWAFDGRFPVSLADLEDTLRRAIVQVGEVARVLVVNELSLPALKARMASGDKIQPAWGEFLGSPPATDCPPHRGFATSGAMLRCS